MSDNLALLKTYDTWAKRRAFEGGSASPETFLEEMHTEALLIGLSKAVRDGAVNTELYFEEDDLDWLSAQEFAAVSVD